MLYYNQRKEIKHISNLKGGINMRVMKGTKREITLFEWGEVLAKAEKRLADSKKCYELFGDEDSRKWVEEDTAKVNKIKQQIKEVTEFMNKYGIK